MSLTVRGLLDALEGAMDPGVACPPGVKEDSEVTVWVPEGIETDTTHGLLVGVSFDGVDWNVDLELDD